MVAYDLFFYVWLITTAIPCGAILGLVVGWLMAKVLKEGKRSDVIILGDLAAGVAGFVLGAFTSTIGEGSVTERWENGKLVFRETTGFGDYIYIFAIVGSVILVATIHIGKAVVNRLPCKSKRDGKYPDPRHAV